MPTQLGADVSPAFNTGHASGIEALEELGVHILPEKENIEKGRVSVGQRATKGNADDQIRNASVDEDGFPAEKHDMSAADMVDNMEEIALYALHTEDDPSLNPWTFRTWFLGMLIWLDQHPARARLTHCRAWACGLFINFGHHISI